MHICKRSARLLNAKLAACLIALTTIFGTIVATAPAAHAAGTLTGIQVTVTQTQCPQGGKVSRVNVAIDQPGSSGTNWSGDTVGGLTALSGAPIGVHGSNFCSGWVAWNKYVMYYWYWSVNRYFSFNNQHTYV
jgi:hypothetical protein